ncbi:hypothetical protein ACE1HO_003474 [Vibrio cholerae]
MNVREEIPINNFLLIIAVMVAWFVLLETNNPWFEVFAIALSVVLVLEVVAILAHKLKCKAEALSTQNNKGEEI